MFSGLVRRSKWQFRQVVFPKFWLKHLQIAFQSDLQQLCLDQYQIFMC